MDWLSELNLLEWGSVSNIILAVIAVSGLIFGIFKGLPSLVRLVKKITAPPDVIQDNRPHQSFFVPYSRNNQLCHATEAVNRIRENLDEKGAAVVSQQAVISGPGGLGKTAMALEYAYQEAHEYPGGVYWLQAERGLGQALFELDQRMKREDFDCGIREGQGEREALRCFQAHLDKGEKSLVILDNLEDRDQAKGIFPKMSHVLITTRIPDLPMAQVTLDFPAEDQAEDIFVSYALLSEEDRTKRVMAAVADISGRVGRLPLALEILGRLAITEGVVPLSRRLEGCLDRPADTSLRGPTTIRAVLGLAEKRYGGFRINRLVKKTLPYLAYLAPEEITPDILCLAMNTRRAGAQKALAALGGFSVVTRRAEGGYSIHRLTQDAARAGDRGDRVGQRAAKAFSDLIEDLLKRGAYKKGYPLIPHLTHLAGLADEATPETEFPANPMVSKWSEFIRLAGLHQSAEGLSRSALARVGREKGRQHPHYATLLNNLAVGIKGQGRFEEAEKLYRKALAIDKKTIGTEHPEYAKSLNNLAGVVRKQGRLEEAEDLYRQALEIDENTIGTEHPNYATHLNNLAIVIQEQGRLEEAEALFREALAIDEKTIGNEHPEYATHLNNLAGVVYEQGRLEEAEGLYHRALDILTERLGPDHPETNTVRANLVDLLKRR